MKKWMKKIGIETLFGFLFSVITIIAIIMEMSIAGFDSASIAGGVKDLFGTLITIVVFVVAVSALKKSEKKKRGFQVTFDSAMETIIKKYNPIVTFYGVENTQKISDAYRYNIANKLDCVVTNTPGGNNKFFRIKEGMSEIEFSVSATVFADAKNEVASNISAKIIQTHSDFISNYRINETGFVLELHEKLASEDDATKMAEIVDHILMLYIAEYKRK